MRGFFAKQHRGKLSCRLARLLLLAIMADVSDESYPTEPHKTKHKRDRNERRARDRANRYGDGMDGTSSSAKERNNPGLDDSGVANDLASTGDRVESARRDRRERRKPKEEVETHANDEAPVEGATAATEETSPKKSLKKDRKSENSAHKRQAKRHLREKRRSTGVVIMPGGADGDSEEDDLTKQVKTNTQQNEQANDDEVQSEDTPRSKGSNRRIEQKAQKDSETIQTQQLREKIDDYETQIEDYKSELDKVNKELEQLRLDNQRLKIENSSLLRVISVMKPK